MNKTFSTILTASSIMILATSCAIFHWDIHAPGLLSAAFTDKVQPLDSRVALFIQPQVKTFTSTERGGKTADPQTYHVGEAYTPMIIEAFQQGFSEFIFIEVEPTKELLKQYGIPYLVVTDIKDFGNRVTWKGQGLAILTESAVYDTNMNLIARFESQGVSDAQRVFAKKGGPQVNLNSAIENNVESLVHYLQDSITTQNWQRKI